MSDPGYVISNGIKPKPKKFVSIFAKQSILFVIQVSVINPYAIYTRSDFNYLS